jgi:hypothetical protein
MAFINPHAPNQTIFVEDGVLTPSRNPQTQVDVTISYATSGTKITVTPNGLSAGDVDYFNITVQDMNGKVANLQINPASPAAVDKDLNAAGLDLTRQLRVWFQARKEPKEVITGEATFMPNAAFSKQFDNKI